MTNDVNNTAAKCISCTWNRRNNKKQQKLQLFSSAGSLDFVAIDILRALPKTERGNEYTVEITNRYSKLSTAIPTTKITTTTNANIFMERWLANLGILYTELMDNRSQFTSKCFATLCKELGFKTVTTTVYRPQVYGQVERFNAETISRLRHYVGENPQEWDTFGFPLMYAYNVQVHRTTKLPPSNLEITQLPPGHAAIARPMPPDVSETSHLSPLDFG